MFRTILLAATALSGLAGAAHACNVPNPNLLGPPFVDNCPIPASVLNRLQNVPTLTNATLKAVPTAALTTGQTMFRSGFTAAGDGGSATYTFSSSACSLNSGNGDNGSQVKPTSGGGCWLANFTATPPNIVQFGADPTGAADSGPAFQAAYAATAGTQDCVFVPAGTYLIGTQIVMSGNPPCFRGVKPNTAEDGATKTGTWIHIASTSVQPFLISGTTSAGKAGITYFGFYNDQPAPAASWAPSAYQYPIVITSGAQDLEFRGLYFYNTTHCISLSGTGRVTFDDISGQPVGTCFLADNVLDIIYLDHFHLWPFWSKSVNVMQYTQQNVDPIVLQRVDSPMLGRLFTLGYHSGIKFASSGNGVTTGFQIDSLQTDVNKYGIWVTGSNTQGHIANFRGASGNYDLSANFAAGSEVYRDESAASDVMIANFQSFSSNESAVHMIGSSGLRIANMEVYTCNGANDGSSAVTMDGGGVIAVANLPSVVGTQCASTPFIHAGTGSWFAAPSVRQTWTPMITGTTSGGLANTYTAQYGQFWFDGSKVTAEFNVSATAFSAAIVGNVQISGLPFTSTGLTNMRGACTISQYSGVVLTGTNTSLSAVVPLTSATLQFIENAPGVAGIPLPASTLSSGASFVGSCTYQVN